MQTEIRPARITGRRRPKREVRLSDVAPTNGPVKNPVIGPAILFNVARESVRPRCRM